MSASEGDEDDRAAIQLLQRLSDDGGVEFVSTHAIALLAPAIARLLDRLEPGADRGSALSGYLIDHDEVADLYVDDEALEALLRSLWDPRPRPRPRSASPARRDDLEALLRREPDDWDHHLVYGDWLQTQRDVFGELIVRRVAAAQAPDDASLAESALEFEGVHREALFGRLAEYLGVVVQLDWRGGFISGATLGKLSSDPEQYQGAILLGWLLDNRAAMLLRDLEIRPFDHSVRDQHAELLAVVLGRTLPLLRRLAVLHATDRGDAGRLRGLAERLPNLEVLELRVRGASVPELSHPTLRRLVWDVPVALDQAAAFARAKLPRLEHLSFGGWMHDALGPALAKLDAPSLRSLRLRTRGEPLDDVLGSAWCEGLEVLDLSDGCLDGPDVARLIGMRWPRLRRLDLSGNTLDAAAIAAVAGLCPEVVTDGQGRREVARQDEDDDGDEYYDSVHE